MTRRRAVPIPASPFPASAIVALMAVVAVHPAQAQPAKVLYVPGSTQKICQLTGEASTNTTHSRYGVLGVDLGVPVEHDGRLLILFGDTSGSQADAVDPAVEFNPPSPYDPTGATPLPPPPPTHNLDSIGWTRDTVADLEANRCVRLDFIADPTRTNPDPAFAGAPIYMPPQVAVPYSTTASIPSIGHGTFRVPVSGVGWNGRFYTFFATFAPESEAQPDPTRRSILASVSDADVTAGRLDAYRYHYDVSRFGGPSGYQGDPGNIGKFINIASVLVNPGEVPGLPTASGPLLVMWGTGYYRKSDVYLAYVPLAQIEQRSAWRYLTGVDASGTPTFLANAEASAIALFRTIPASSGTQGSAGEISVTWNPFLQRWLMTYTGSLDPRGLPFHVAERPWGPWTPIPTVPVTDLNTHILFNPDRDPGYGEFMHIKDGSDALADDAFGTMVPHSLTGIYRPGPVRSGTWGGEYGGYVIPRYTIGDTKSTRLRWLLSTWNPYQVFLMESTLRLQRPPIADAGPDATVNADNACTARVTLDGRGSSDPDDDTLTYLWTGPFGTAHGATTTVTLSGAGPHVITLTVNDGWGGQASDTVIITVADITAPQIDVQLSPVALWPPNHRMVPIAASLDVRDNCDPAPRAWLDAVTSSEPDNGRGDGNTVRDIQDAALGTDDRLFSVRAERSGSGSGRVYTVRYAARDASSNTATAEATVTVPHH